jgi:hypothetical protein
VADKSLNDKDDEKKDPDDTGTATNIHSEQLEISENDATNDGWVYL